MRVHACMFARVCVCARVHVCAHACVQRWGMMHMHAIESRHTQ